MSLRKVDIEIYDEAGRRVRAERHDLPALVGRGADVKVKIQDARDLVSRHHLEIRGAPTGFIIVNKSKTNGTLHNGHRLPVDVEYRLSNRERIDIPGFGLVLMDVAEDAAHKGASAFPLKVRVKKKPTDPDRALALGSGVVAVTMRSGVYEVQHLQPAPTETIFQHYRSKGATPILVIAADSQHTVGLTVAPDVASPVTINNGPVGAAHWKLSEMDVVMIKALRLEIMREDVRYIRCSNPSCTLLNHYHQSGNCRWCGYHLPGGVTVALKS